MPYRTEPFIDEIAIGGYVEPVGRRASYTSSRLAVLSDNTTKPVLLILAEHKFEKWEAERFPFWIDGDRTNETLQNVSLATRSAGVSRQRRRRSRNAFGIPAGTREYMRRWRETHPQQVRAAQSRYHEKRSTILATAATHAEDELPPVFQKLQNTIDEK